MAKGSEIGGPPTTKRNGRSFRYVFLSADLPDDLMEDAFLDTADMRSDQFIAAAMLALLDASPERRKVLRNWAAWLLDGRITLRQLRSRGLGKQGAAAAAVARIGERQRGGATVAQRFHSPCVAGSNPAPASER